MVRAFFAVILMGFCLWAVPAVAAPSTSPDSCATAVGDRVMLRSSDFDPDVLVWDARQRSKDYVSGGVHSMSELLDHTLLSKPGTRAIVIMCDPASARPSYSSIVLDTIGIKITAGPNKGRYGWVSSDDTHANLPAMAATP